MSHNENIFDKLESNDKDKVEAVKQSLREQFNKVSEPWLLYGLYEYYLSTNSFRSMEILTTLREPHHQYLFERLCDSLKSPKVELRVQALTLLGHIARSQPSWLYKLPHHALFRELLRLLQREEELLPLISALLVLIVLLPMIPSSVGPHLEDVFAIFLRLAAWNSSYPGKLGEDQMIHLQVALYALFLRLYGMFPCNFVTYLRTHFKHKNRPIFTHTIKPMLDTVKMHSSLVTTSKEHETTTERWLKMDVHDVIIECERFSLDITDRCPHDTCQNASGFRSRSGTTNSTIESFQLQNIKSLSSLQVLGNENSFFTPSQVFHVQTPPITEATPATIQGFSKVSNYIEGTSPPEAAIEATPETTPIRDFRTTPSLVHHPSLMPTSSAARALTSFRSSGSFSIASPSHSQPSSPMKKEPSPFPYTNITHGDQENILSGRASAFSRPVVHSQRKSSQLILERQQIASESQQLEAKSKPPPSSPLRIINPSETTNRQQLQQLSQSYHRSDSPVSQEDEEVSSIVSKRSPQKRAVRPCDSVLPEFDNFPESNDIEQEHGSPCTEGGLHMPNSKSMNNFRRGLSRYRHYSQCNPEPDKIEMSTGSSPGKGVGFPGSTVVRRANSCPEMEKSPKASLKDNKRKPFYETDEETVSEDQAESLSGNSNGLDAKEHKKVPKISTTTQTDNFWPMPYEHLFFNIFPALDAIDVKPSPAPSPAPFNLSQHHDKFQPSLYDVLDRYVEKAIVTADSKGLTDQLQLLHQQLLFERHRRETHAYRNRRLLSDARNTRLLEECNSALKDQVQLKQKDIDDCRMQLEDYRVKDLEEKESLHTTLQYWEDQFKSLQDETIALKQSKYQLEKDNAQYREQCNKLERERQDALADLMDAIAEINVVRVQAQSAEKVRAELNQANRELLMMGELLTKYREALDKPTAKRQVKEEMVMLNSAYKQELSGLHSQLEAKSAQTEAYKHRLADQEQMLLAKDEVILSNKRTLAAASQEREALIEAVESKYETQKRINLALEMRCLELLQRLELETGKRNANSPDTSSCHEVQVATTPSPLSTSLASSAGSSVPLGDVRNLQALVDQPESSVVTLRTATGPYQVGFADSESGKHHHHQGVGGEPSTSSKK